MFDFFTQKKKPNLRAFKSLHSSKEENWKGHLLMIDALEAVSDAPVMLIHRDVFGCILKWRYKDSLKNCLSSFYYYKMK